MSEKQSKNGKRSRRSFTPEFKEEAVRMLLDGHSAASVAERLGLSGANALYRWKRKILGEEGAIASDLESRVRQLEAELARVERERDILPLEMSISPAHVFLLLSC
jgi:transposase